jgi:hypothetical protein
MYLEAPNIYNEGGKIENIVVPDEVDISSELLYKIDKHTVQPWVELVDNIDGKIVRIRIINDGRSPKEMIQNCFKKISMSQTTERTKTKSQRNISLLPKSLIVYSKK